MDVQRMELEGLHVGAGALLALLDRALVDSHQGAYSQSRKTLFLRH
jgi:hypothetical protein